MHDTFAEEVAHVIRVLHSLRSELLELQGCAGQWPAGMGTKLPPPLDLTADIVSELSTPDTQELDFSGRGLQKLIALPAQLAELQKLNLSRASACAECRCICGPWTVEQGERWAGA